MPDRAGLTLDPGEAPVARARLVVAYDGAHFHGFAENEGVRTVAGELRGAIARSARHPVDLVGAGRTDAGVHAWGQVVSTDLRADLDLPTLVRRVNSQVAPHLLVRAAEWAPAGFSARFDASWRAYRYTVLAEPQGDPFLAGTAWHVAAPLSLRSMRLACDPLIGEHDFSAFCRRPRTAPGEQPASLVRRVLSAEWHEEVSWNGRRLLRLDIRATAFCHQMVRSIVGTLVDVGLGRLHAGDLGVVLRSGDRAAAGRVAPPHGLCLWEVGYPPEGAVRG